MEIDLLFFFKKKWKHMYFYLIHHLSVITPKSCILKNIILALFPYK